MNISDAYEVVEALSTNEVNSKLQKGWKLLTVVGKRPANTPS